MTQEVVFLYRKRLARSGSKFMRCDQLAQIGTQYLGDRYAFSTRALPRTETAAQQRDLAETLSGKIVILLKGSAAFLGDSALQALRKKCRGLAIDYVDADARGCFSPHADLHIAASLTGQDILRGLLLENGSVDGRARVAYLTHHFDPRLADLHLRPQNRVRAVYLGHPRNAYLPDDICQRITQIDLTRGEDMHVAFDRLCDFNLQYAIRAPDQDKTATPDVAKPFTKGFVAAALGANVLVSRHTDDALLHLGADYPFLTDNNDLTTILATLDLAEGIFDTPQWHEATDRMRYLRDISSPRHIAREFDVILSQLSLR